MTGLDKKKYVTVIMDGSNKSVVEHIRLACDLVNQCEIGSAVCYPLSDEHPNVVIVETITTRKLYNDIKSVIEETYPGLCLFNVSLQVA